MNENDYYDPSLNSKIGKRFVTLCAILSIVIGIVILIFYIKKVSDTFDIHIPINLTNYGVLGDFIGGVVGTFFSLGGFFLLYLTLKDQRDNFHKERLELAFFERIKFHGDNINEMTYKYFADDSWINIQGREVFKVIFTQFNEAWSESKILFDSFDVNFIYEKEYLYKLQSNQQIKERKIDLKEMAQIDLIYLIIYYGVNDKEKMVIENLTKNRYNSNFINYLLDLIELKPQKQNTEYWEKWNFINKLSNIDNKSKAFHNLIQLHLGKLNNNEIKGFYPENQNGKKFLYPANMCIYDSKYSKYYTGFQYFLGHYYRHIFQTIKFIQNEKYLLKNEKYNYIKVLRGQLSNYEQLIFFLNSLSVSGRIWESFDVDNNTSQTLLSEYHLIKNIPVRYIQNIDVLRYYPNIKYELIK